MHTHAHTHTHTHDDCVLYMDLAKSFRSLLSVDKCKNHAHWVTKGAVEFSSINQRLCIS